MEPRRWNDILLSGYSVRWRGAAAFAGVIFLTFAAARLSGGKAAEVIFMAGFVSLALVGYLRRGTGRLEDEDPFGPEGGYLEVFWDPGFDVGGDGGGGGDG